MVDDVLRCGRGNPVSLRMVSRSAVRRFGGREARSKIGSGGGMKQAKGSALSLESMPGEGDGAKIA